MKRVTFFIPYLLILAQVAFLAGCAIFESEERGEVIEKSTTTTIERPVVEERTTTTTTTIETED